MSRQRSGGDGAIPSCIAGMHRSGTSLVSRVANLAGLDLGPSEELMLPSEESPDGYWESARFVALNEEILDILGGGWDAPPAPPAAWGTDLLAPTAQRAGRLVAEFGGREPWGWKDPRNSLTLPFWRQVLPELRTILCVRNPLEVALSLQRRGSFSYGHSLSLWLTYNRRFLESLGGDGVLVVDYERLLGDPAPEIDRLIGYLCLSPSAAARQTCTAAVEDSRRHHRLGVGHLLDAKIDPGLLELYLHLLALAAEPGAVLPGDLPAEAGPEAQTAARRMVDATAVDLELARRQIQLLRGGVEERDHRLVELNAQLERSERRRRDAETAADAMRNQARQAEADRDQWQARFGRSLDRLVRDQHRAREVDHLARDEMFSAIDDLGATGDGEYAQLVRRVRGLVRQVVPPGATAAVISRGDEELVRLHGRRGLHFPSDEAGGFRGWYPASDGAATAHLEGIRGAGADYLVVPATSMWWFDTYPGLQAHLTAHYRLLLDEPETGQVYALQTDPTGGGDRLLGDVLLDLADQLGRTPAAIDWTTGGLPATVATIVAGPPGCILPHLDHSVDVVAISDGDTRREREALRVASAAVIRVDVSPTGGRPLQVASVTRQQELAPADAHHVSIVVEAAPDPARQRRLLEDLASSVEGELIVVGALDDDSELAPGRLDPGAAAVHRVGCDKPGALAWANAGAMSCSGDILVFVGATTTLSSGWMPPLVRVLSERPEAVAVGGKVVAADGTLAEAGWRLYSDGSSVPIGRGEPRPDAPPYSHLGPVDFCSARLLAVRRDAFEQVGGFSSEYLGARFACADLCLALQQRGGRVFFQPDSVAITSWAARLAPDGDANERDRALLTDRWGAVLQHRSPPPPRPLLPR